jgi:DNA repair protein RadD
MIETRRYQTRSVAACLKAFKRVQRVLLVGPTASGKTVTAVRLLKQLGRKRILWIAHRFELLEQAVAELVAAGVPETDIGILSGTRKENTDARIIVASVQMFEHRSVESLAPDVLVIDEAHRAEAKSYAAIIFAAPDALVLGLTATPWRLDGSPLSDTFAEMVVMSNQSELIADGHIAAPVTYGMPLDKARKIVSGLKTHRGDYAQAELGKKMMRGTLMGDIVSEVKRLAKGQPTIVFAANREHGQALAVRFDNAGFSCAYLDGDTAKDARRTMLAKLKARKVQVIVNVDVLSEGFDCPPVKCIALARPTKSLTRYLQQVGRGGRPYKGIRPIVLDHAGNVWRFGLPHADREWSLDAREKRGGGEAPVKQCVNPNCGALIPIGCRQCPECTTLQPITTREREEAQAELQRIEATRAEQERRREILRKLAAMRGAGEDWVEKAMRLAS